MPEPSSRPQPLEPFRELYELAPFAYVTVDRHGAIRNANLAAARLFARGMTVLVGMPLRLFVAHADRRALSEHLAHCTQRRTQATIELRLATPEGERVVELLSQPTGDVDREGAVTCRTAIVDVSARRAAEEARRTEIERDRVAREERLLEAANAAKDRFVSKLSHELRTPLTPVLMIVSALQHRADTPESLRPVLAMIRRNIELEARLIGELLDLACVARSPLDIDAAVASVPATRASDGDGTASGAVPGNGAGTPAATRHRATILLVEDHEDTARTLAAALSLEGYEVRIARSVASALREPTDRVDLVVSDLGLPDGSGLDLMRRLRADRPLPGVALSGYGATADVEKSRTAGFEAHLTKPVAIDVLTRTIEEIVAAAERGETRALAAPLETAH
jgi:PAS domain S-box-containing protein